MKEPLPPADLSGVRTYPLRERRNKVCLEQFGREIRTDGSVAEFLDGLADVLAVRSLRELATSIVDARARAAPVVLAMGGHVIKVGQAPVLRQLMERELLSGLVLNGAAAIHDWEIAAIGATSEDVEEGLHGGRFGMAEETGREFAEAARQAVRTGEGLGLTLGRRMLERSLPYLDSSLVARATELSIPCTVHVAVGCDIVHQHPRADGGAIGQASFTDFRRLVSLVSGLSGGVWINCGSAVQLPEVFLKALSVAQNLGHGVQHFATANLDMQRHYRTDENVLRRPTAGRGRGYAITGHHEILLPLLAAATLGEQARRAGGGS